MKIHVGHFFRAYPKYSSLNFYHIHVMFELSPPSLPLYSFFELQISFAIRTLTVAVDMNTGVHLVRVHVNLTLLPVTLAKYSVVLIGP